MTVPLLKLVTIPGATTVAMVVSLEVHLTESLTSKLEPSVKPPIALMVCVKPLGDETSTDETDIEFNCAGETVILDTPETLP